MDSQEHEIPKGSGKDVDDFSSFCEGDIEPTLNKTINSLVDSAPDYIVYIDNDCFVEWAFNGDTPPGFGAISNKSSHLQSLSRTLLRKAQLNVFSGLLAEGMARIIGDKDEAKANEALDRAKAYLDERAEENARAWYLRGAALSALPSLLIACILWLLKSQVVQFLGSNVFEVVLGSLLGGIGALLFVFSRSEKIQMDPTAGPFIHYIESASRILVGNLGGFLIALAIKANVLFGFANTVDHSFKFLAVFCFCAGYSEKLVSGFIKRIETSVGTDNKNIQPKTI